MKSGFIKNRSDTSDYIIRQNIENMIIQWSLVDPVTLSDNFQICDGSAWKDNSYAKEYWTVRGITTIRDLRGYHPRGADYGAANDPDRADRRQGCSGTVAGNGLSVVVPRHYANVVYEAILHSRTVVIGINPGTIFDTLVTYATASSVDRSTNTIYLGSAITTGTQSLVIKGDVIGSFQADALQGFKPSINIYGYTGSAQDMSHNSLTKIVGGATSNTGPSSFSDTGITTDGTNGTPRTSSESRSKNISLLPVMWVRLPSATVTGYTARYEEGELGNELRFLMNYKAISSNFPWFCMSLPDQLWTTTNYPQDFITIMRNKKVVYDELNTNVSSFSGSWSTGTYTLDDNSANNSMLAELYEDWLFAGSPTTNWRLLNDGTWDFNITNIVPGSRQITVSTADHTPSGTSISIYLHRVYNSTTSARHFSWAGLGMYMTGGGKVTGLRRRDAMQGHWHDAYASPHSGSNFGTRIEPSRSEFLHSNSYISIRSAITDGTNGTPRTDTKTRIESGTLLMYLYAGTYTV